MLNLEAYLAEEAGAKDMVTDRSFTSLLEAKLDRFTGGQVTKDSFYQLIQIEGLPDLSSAIGKGQIDVARSWDFRNKKTAQQFRKWFDDVGPISPEDMTKKYVATLKESGFWDSRRAKVARFVVIQGIGLGLTPVAGPAPVIASLGLSLTDCFLLNRIRLGFKPRYFVDDLRHHLFLD